MRLFLISALAVVVGAIMAPRTDALVLIECSSKQAANTQLNCGRTNVRKGQTTLRFLRKNKDAGTDRSRHNVRRAANYVIRYGKKHISIATQRIQPPHKNGWLCIHSGEGSWTANTGNGYYGGLQMTYNWMRAIGGINGRASDYSPLEQMWAAERVSRRFGFSYSWMKGQWPNTYPPCMRYF